QSIVLTPALPDQTHVARMRHDHFMAQPAQQPAHPGRMHAGLQRDAAARHGSECRWQSLGRGGNSLFQHDTPRLIQNAVAARAIPQVQTDGQLLLRKIPALLPGCSANLLHCRSPLSLVLQSTSITWERTASRRRPAFSSHLITTVELTRKCGATVILDRRQLLTPARIVRP